MNSNLLVIIILQYKKANQVVLDSRSSRSDNMYNSLPNDGFARAKTAFIFPLSPLSTGLIFKDPIRHLPNRPSPNIVAPLTSGSEGNMAIQRKEK
jgi:hypothetical protein